MKNGKIINKQAIDCFGESLLMRKLKGNLQCLIFILYSSKILIYFFARYSSKSQRNTPKI